MDGIYKSYWVFKNSNTGQYIKFSDFCFSTVTDLIGAKMFATLDNAKYFEEAFRYRLQAFDIYEIKVKEYIVGFPQKDV